MIKGKKRQKTVTDAAILKHLNEEVKNNLVIFGLSQQYIIWLNQ